MWLVWYPYPRIQPSQQVIQRWVKCLRLLINLDNKTLNSAAFGSRWGRFSWIVIIQVSSSCRSGMKCKPICAFWILSCVLHLIDLMIDSAMGDAMTKLEKLFDLPFTMVLVVPRRYKKSIVWGEQSWNSYWSNPYMRPKWGRSRWQYHQVRRCWTFWPWDSVWFVSIIVYSVSYIKLPMRVWRTLYTHSSTSPITTK